jgi:hypothetical protein
MCDGVPYQCGLRWNSAIAFFVYCVSTNGPPPTSGWPFSGSLAYVLSAFPSPVAYWLHTCSGRIGVIPTSDSAVAVGRS